jgi:cell division protein FtsB
MKFISLLFVVLLLWLQYRLWIGNGSLTEVHHLEQAKQVQAEENERLLERNLSLAAEVHDLKNGFEAMEEQARSEMGMIKKDETFYLVIDKSSTGERQE